MANTNEFIEEVELRGHIIDSLLLAKVFDTILAMGGSYTVNQMTIGEKQTDPSLARIAVKAPNSYTLELILAQIQDHGAVPVHHVDCEVVLADVAGAFPEGFYSTTNFRTQILMHEEWVEVQQQEMDCGIRIISPTEAVCIPMVNVQIGDAIVVGRKGIRVFPPENKPKRHLFEFMSSAVSSEKPKGATVREIAAEMRRTKAAGAKILAVLGPAVVHTGGSELVSWLIENNWLDILFAGNALATHDLEQAFYGTSLGVSLDRGIPAEEGHEHHLRTINTIRRYGGIAAAVQQGKLTSGIMHACTTKPISYVLAGSIRDDGPLPEVITDSLKAQTAMRAYVPEVGFCLMVATTLHSIAVGNLLPAWVRVACIDINPATVTKLMDRGSIQTIGIVSDAEPFLRNLVQELK